MSEANGNIPENETPDTPESGQSKQLLVVSKDGTVRPSENASGQAARNPAPEAASEAEKTPAQKTGFAAAAPNNPEPAGNLMSESKNIQPLVTPVVVKQSSGRAVAVVALAFSLLAVGAAGFLFVQGQNLLKTQEMDFNQKIDKAALGESQNAALLQEILRKQNSNQSLLDQVADSQKQHTGQIAAANKAYRELLKSRADWLVDETETMLNIGLQQLLLTGNVPAAINVLENVENRLNRFDHPELLPIKQAVSTDLTALKNRPYLDVPATSLRLDRLEAAVSGLPLMVDGTLQPGKSAPAPAPAANLPWWEKAWQNTVSAPKGMVEVRRLNNNDAMLIAPEQTYFVRENLRLRLLDARTALLQHNGEVYLNDLNNVETTVKQYFDTASPATQSWLRELGELKALNLHSVSEDVLKNSLNAVRNYQETVRPSRPSALPEAAASAPAAVPETPASAPAAQASEPKTEPASAPAVTPSSPSNLNPKKEETPDDTKPSAAPLENKPASVPNTVKGERA